MKLVEFVPPVKHPLWKLCLQMGIADVIVKVNPTLTGLPDPWRYETLKAIVEGLRVEGLRVVGLEGDPFDMTPIKQFGENEMEVEGGGGHPVPSCDRLTLDKFEEGLWRGSGSGIRRL